MRIAKEEKNARCNTQYDIRSTKKVLLFLAKRKVTLKNKPFLLIIRDGWGYNPNRDEDEYNAVKCGNTPTDDMLLAEYPNCLIHTSGEDVGLTDGTMVNSEVGHQNISAGRIVPRESVRISRAIRDGSFFKNKEFHDLIKFVKDNNGKMHIMGLCSDIGVHSLLDHLYGLVELAKRNDVKDVFDRIYRIKLLVTKELKFFYFF